MIPSFQRLLLRSHELLRFRYGGEPVGKGAGEKVAAPLAHALDEWEWLEELETGAGRCQGLATTFRTSVRVLQKINYS